MEKFSNISKQIKESAKKGQVNLIYPFFEIEEGKKLSIVGEYYNKEESIVNGMGEDNVFDKSTYYYGLSPLIDSYEICNALQKGIFDSVGNLKEYIKEKKNFFTVPKSMQKYAQALFAKTLVKMSIMFGSSFEVEDEQTMKVLEETGELIFVNENEFDINVKERNLRILGSPSQESIKNFEDKFALNNGKLVLKKHNSDDSLKKYLSEKKYYSLVQGRSYYSGVLPRVKKFEVNDNIYSNSSITNLTIKFGRVTFATMDAFDSSFIKTHRLLKDYMLLLEEIDQKEDDNIREYLVISDNQQLMLDKVNNFLEKSFSAHNLAVSANITTKDDYLILAKRNKKNIDSDTYYCSINGQSEISDKNVSFYSQSVYEDMPTININNEYRIDFFGELERETKAELNIDILKQNWQLCGVSFLAIEQPSATEAKCKFTSVTSDADDEKSDENKVKISRRFHFNILAQSHIEYDLGEVLTLQKDAAEKFENSNLIGIKFNYYKKIGHFIWSSLKNIAKWGMKSKELITSILAISIFGLSVTDLVFNGLKLNDITNIVNIIFSILTIIVFLNNILQVIIKFAKRRKTYFRKYIIKDINDFYNDIHNHFKKKNVNFHPITDVMVYEYIKKLVSKKSKDK